MFITVYSILGLVKVSNVRQMQRRVRSKTRGGYMQRKDRYLLRMLLFQVVFNIVVTIPLAIYPVETTSILLY